MLKIKEEKKHKIDIRKMIYGAFMIALGIVFPMIFHMFGATGPVFLPMHTPVIIAGLLLGPYYGLTVGFLTPILSSLLTGMPPLFPVLPIMVLELTFYGFFSGLFMKRTKKLFISQYVAMISGRVGYAIMYYFLIYILNKNIPGSLSVFSAVVTGLPGIAIQLLLIPLLFKAFQRMMNHEKISTL